jgi:hypothetical protein
MVTYAEDRSCITQFELGELFHKGNQKTRDFEQAFKWYKAAAKKLFQIVCLVQGCRLPAFTTCPTQAQIHRTTNELGSNPTRQLDGAGTL